MAGIFNSKLDSILEGTSRSFYLSLKELPRPIRRQVSLLYLLARTSDTIADSESSTPEDRLKLLREYGGFCQGSEDEGPDLSNFADLQSNQSEARLLNNTAEITSKIVEFDDRDQDSIRRCLGTIISGQILDLERFSNPSGKITSLSEDSELDDYAYRVAGSVGEFWTRMSLAHLFQTDKETEEKMFESGVQFGKALQMINILRDIPSDLSIGRCYIPENSLERHGLIPEDLLKPSKMDKFRPLYDELLDLTTSHLDSAVQYIGLIPHGQFRLRGACMLPVIIGRKTVSKLREGNVLDPKNRIKIDRSEVRGLVRKIVMSVPFQKTSNSLLNG
jgi:farnesyl-diphosphate farnesyltransferase